MAAARRDSVLLYRILVVVLLGAVVLLSVSTTRLGEQLDRIDAEKPTPMPAARAMQTAQRPAATTARPSANEDDPSTRVSMVDVGKLIDKRTRVHADAPDSVVELFRSPFGIVRVHLVSFGHMFPLHMHRVGHTALTVVQGSARLTAISGPGRKPIRIEHVPQPGALLHVGPYVGHRFENESETEMLAVLEFQTPGQDDLVHVDPDDARQTWGDRPALVPAPPWKASETPALLLGKLTAVTLRAPAPLEGGAGPTLAYVVAGAGEISGAGTRSAAAGQMIMVPPGVRTTLTPDAAGISLHVFRPSTDDASEILRTQKKKYSQNDEELVIRDYFRDRRGGVFLDVGASHYARDSTTFYLEEQLGWRGVAVDALAEYAADYAVHRKNTRYANFLITDEARGLQKFYRAEKYPEVSSAKREVASEQADVYRGDDSVTELEVQSITLTELLDDLDVTAIDFLSMDIEEYEPAALRGFDIDRFKPELVCIEAHRSVQDFIYGYFHRHGYVRLDQYLPYERFNWYFARADVLARRQSGGSSRE